MPRFWYNPCNASPIAKMSRPIHSPEKYQIFDHMIEGVQIIDREFRYAYVNEAVAKQGKQAREELLGKTMMEKYPGIEHSEVFRLIKTCMADRGYRELINEFDFPDGSKGYFMLRMEAVEEGVLILSFDITDQKNAERIIKNANEQLEEMVRIRTSELMEHRIIIEQQIEHLKKLDAAKNKFFSIVAHDLITPLNSLKSLSNLLQSGLKDLSIQEVEALSKDLQQSADNSIKLAQNLITWARMQMNDQEVRPESIDLEEAISEVWKLYKDLSAKKSVNLTYTVETACKAFGDKNQIAFIVRNLVNNAIKYTEAQGTVSIAATILSPEELCIAVSDNGVGISDDLRANLFNPEYKSSLNGTSGEAGTGMGLMLCQEFVTLNNGRIGLESKPGKGTTFRVILKRPVNTA